jgi:hypothetical protein
MDIALMSMALSQGQFQQRAASFDVSYEDGNGRC